ncbi:MAG: ATP-binding protein [Nitrospira sp.]|jgi:two-component system NtrC family sensor kinase|nr:ATP-binding protein [Nitrospira sp.]
MATPRPAQSLYTRQGTRWGLKAKLILSMLFVGVVPLVVGLSMAFWQGSQEIRDVNGESFKALATEAARKLDLLVADEVARTARIANDPLVVQELERRRDALANRQAQGPTDEESRWAARDPGLVKQINGSPLAALLQEYYTGTRSAPDQLLPQVVRSATKMLFLTDLQGTLVAAMTANPSYRHSQTPWWQGAYNKGVGKLYIEDVHFNKQADAYVFTISVPVMDSLRYEVVGVLHRVIDAKEFFSPSTHVIRFGKTGHVMLIDSRGIVMSCPILPTGVALSDRSLTPLITLLQPGWVEAPSDGHGGHTASIIGFAPLPETSRATNGSLSGGSWHTFVWQSSDELFAPIQHLFMWMTVFGSVAIALLAVLGYVAASRIVTPVRTLQQAAQAIGRGELRTAIDIRTGDELQDLADEFNRMNAQLEAAFAGLTDQVTLKTQEVTYLQRSTDQILDAVPTPIILLNTRESVQYMNRAARAAFHLSPEATLPFSLATLQPLGTVVHSQLRQDAAGEEAGSPPQSGHPRDPLAPAASHDAGHTRSRSELQIGPRTYHYQWFRLPGRPGIEPRIGLVLRDITDESRLQDQLIQAEKSGSLGVLTAGIGHELNNPLFGIVGLGEAILDETDLSRAQSHARDIVAQGQRMAAIIRDFTGVTTRESSDQRIPVCIEETIDQALAAMHTAADMRQITIEKLFSGKTMVLALPDQLRQAVMNLLMNAVQAMKGVGTVRISTAVADRFAIAEITDTGPGIAPHHLAKVFDPFFTTKEQGEGSGLGLTVARRIIRKFGGDLRIDSREGQGTTCIMTLPAIPPPPSPEEEPWTASAPRSEPQPSRS